MISALAPHSEISAGHFNRPRILISRREMAHADDAACNQRRSPRRWIGADGSLISLGRASLGRCCAKASIATAISAKSAAAGSLHQLAWDSMMAAIITRGRKRFHREARHDVGILNGMPVREGLDGASFVATIIIRSSRRRKGWPGRDMVVFAWRHSRPMAASQQSRRR